MGGECAGASAVFDRHPDAARGGGVGVELGKERPYFGAFLPGTISVITSKLTSKAQTAIPQLVRAALGVKEGDELAYAIEDGRVVITEAPPKLPRKGDPLEDPFATFWEWDTEEDEQAFADL
jgi:antitoxin PrlF